MNELDEEYVAIDEDGESEVVEINPLLYCSVCESNCDGSTCDRESCPW